MDVFNTLVEQLKGLWSQWSTSQRIGISAATAACVAVIVGTLLWATRADYVPLMSGLTPQRAADFQGILETAGIATKSNISGSTISVPRSKIADARLALKDVWEPTAGEEAGASGMLPVSPNEEADRRKHRMERSIAQSIAQIRGIQSATVHIAMPDPSPFVNEKVPTKASVVITPSSSAPMTHSLAESVISLVAQSVEGLKPDQVFLTDNTGRPFNMADGMGSTMDGQFDYQQRVETRLASKAETMLGMLLGYGNAVVRVSADIDFTETTRTNLSYDPDGKVKARESIETIEQTGTAPVPIGEVGFDANAGAAGGEGNGSSYKKEILDSTFDNASTTEETRKSPGKLMRLTVAVAVDLTPPKAAESDAAAGDDTAAAAQPAPVMDVTAVEEIVKQAVGFDETRGDEIKVVTATLGSGVPESEVPAVVSTWQQYEPMILTVGKGAIACVAFLMAFLLMKRLQPVVVADGATDDQLTLDEVRDLASLSDQARNNPEVAARILSAWMGADTDEEGETDQNAARAA